jgi:predicted esterase
MGGVFLVVLLAASGTDAAAAAPAPPRAATGARGLPAGAPPAATWPEPRLPKPKEWPFGEAFPRTSGTGRLAGGASFWSDFIYDDHGASPGQPSDFTSDLAPARGAYQYPAGPASGNGADIFRAAVGLTDQATYWRVDWTTLVDPRIPIAEWTFDTDGSTQTGVTPWPAGAGVESPGIDRALVVSSRGAWLIDTPSGKRTAIRSLGGGLTVDRPSRSFMVRVPRSALPVRGSWKIRLAAGLADQSGSAFAPVPRDRGGPRGGTAVYNVTFRSYRQEPAVLPPNGYPAALLGPGKPVFQFANFWMENGQAAALFSGDVTPYSLDVRWDRLAAHATTPEPLPRGYTNRWYVSRLNLGHGVVTDSGGNPASGDLAPNYLGRIQPYAVYVPTAYNPAHPTPFTWILHSLGSNHNQYGGVAPDQLQAECERRHSICATTLGYGPDGWYLDEAEVDFWQVWRAVADSYHLDPNRTVISGYSMGGWGTNWLASRYPDLFAKAMELAGPSSCGVRILGPIRGPASQTGPCAADADVLPILENVRWVPFIMVHGVLDELVPITGVLQEMLALDRLGYRYYAQLYPLEDHMALAVQNGWSTEAAQIGDPVRVVNPGHITFSWYPELANPAYGIGPTGVYWVSGLRARRSGPGVLARVDAISQANPDPPVKPFRRTTVAVPASPTPAVVHQLTWSVGYAAKARPEVTLTVTNVAALAVDAARAGLRNGTITLSSDGPTALTLRHLAPNTAIRIAGQTMARANGEGTARVTLRSGRTVLSVG